jgi:hypothetical protein
LRPGAGLREGDELYVGVDEQGPPIVERTRMFDSGEAFLEHQARLGSAKLRTAAGTVERGTTMAAVSVDEQAGREARWQRRADDLARRR